MYMFFMLLFVALSLISPTKLAGFLNRNTYKFCLIRFVTLLLTVSEFFIHFITYLRL